MTGPRVEPIFDIPVRITDELRPLEKLLESLRAVLGRLTPIADLCLLFVDGGKAITGAAGAGTSVVAAGTIIDLADPLIDSARILVRGSNSTATNRTVRVYDTTNSVVIAEITTLTNSHTWYQGSWTTVAFKGGNRTLEVRVIGNGADTQTIDTVRLQLRTARAQQR